MPCGFPTATRARGAFFWCGDMMDPPPPPARSFSFLINHHCQSPNLLAHSRDHRPVMARNVENTCGPRSPCPSPNLHSKQPSFSFFDEPQCWSWTSQLTQEHQACAATTASWNPPIHENAPEYKYIPVPRSTPRAQQRNCSTSSNLWCTRAQIHWAGKIPNCSYRKRRSYEIWRNGHIKVEAGNNLNGREPISRKELTSRRNSNRGKHKYHRTPYIEKYSHWGRTINEKKLISWKNYYCRRTKIEETWCYVLFDTNSYSMLMIALRCLIPQLSLNRCYIPPSESCQLQLLNRCDFQLFGSMVVLTRIDVSFKSSMLIPTLRLDVSPKSPHQC